MIGVLGSESDSLAGRVDRRGLGVVAAWAGVLIDFIVLADRPASEGGLGCILTNSSVRYISSA